MYITENIYFSEKLKRRFHYGGLYFFLFHKTTAEAWNAKKKNGSIAIKYLENNMEYYALSATRSNLATSWTVTFWDDTVLSG
jgi:hypothetical protein